MVKILIYNKVKDGARVVVYALGHVIEFDTTRHRGEFLTEFVNHFCEIVSVRFSDGIMIKLNAPEKRVKELMIILQKYQGAQKRFAKLVEAMQDGTYEDEVKEIMKEVILEKVEKSNI